MRIRSGIALILIGFLVMTSPGMARSIEDKLDVIVDGQILSYPDQQPITDEGSIIVPLRFTAEKMGAPVEWDEQTQSASLSQDGDTFCFYQGKQLVTRNGKALTEWHNLKCINGRIMVPLDLMADAFGYQIKNDTGKIVLTSKPIAITADLCVQKVHDKVYVVTHSFPWPCNDLLVEMNDGQLVLVDTPNTPEATQDLLQWIDKRFGNRQITAFNAHFHFDCLGGNQALVERNIKIYGSELTAELIKERGEAVRTQEYNWLPGPENRRYREAYEKIPYIAPTPLSGLEDGRNLDFGGEKMEIYYPGEAHSPDNLVFYLPQKQLLFGGCMIMSMETKKVGNTADANLKTWPGSVQRLIDRYPSVDLIIPGHGAWGGKDLLLHTQKLVSAAS